MLAFIGGGFGGVGAGALWGTRGAWKGAAGELGVEVGKDVDTSPVSSSSFPSFFLRPNMVSIPIIAKKVQMESRLATWSSNRSTRT